MYRTLPSGQEVEKSDCTGLLVQIDTRTLRKDLYDPSKWWYLVGLGRAGEGGSETLTLHLCV